VHDRDDAVEDLGVRGALREMKLVGTEVRPQRLASGFEVLGLSGVPGTSQKVVSIERFEPFVSAFPVVHVDVIHDQNVVVVVNVVVALFAVIVAACLR
jgi:hypothetical protein